ncbi:MAG: hypothetical protein WBM13_02800 [Bacteroidia bacterium]
MAKIKNINGTSENKCKCGSWLKHWETFSKQKTEYCCVSVPNCTNKDIVGAHVQKDTLSDNNWYIIPLCNEHNKSKEILEVSDTRPLISANVKNTCGI